MNEQLEIDAQLIPGSGGIFEIRVNGALVASKDRSGFPEERDLVDAVARALTPP